MKTGEQAQRALDQIAETVHEARNPALSWTTTNRLLEAVNETVDHLRGLVEDLTSEHHHH